MKSDSAKGKANEVLKSRSLAEFAAKLGSICRAGVNCQIKPD